MIGYVVFVFIVVIIVIMICMMKIRRRNSQISAYIVVPFSGDIKDFEMTVKGYYYEELFEAPEYRREILVLCDDKDKPKLCQLKRISHTVMIVNENELLSKINKRTG